MLLVRACRIWKGVDHFPSCRYVTQSLTGGVNKASKTAPLSTQAVRSEISDKAVKPFSELPGPKGLPIVGTVFQFPRDMTKQEQFLRERCDNFFPIYKEDVGFMKLVVIYDVEDIEKLFRMESKYPERFEVESWSYHRKVYGQTDGLLTSNGENWYHMRRVVDKPMLRIKDVATYTDGVNAVLTDFISRVNRIKDADGLVPELETELFNWSLETIGLILYEKRFGGLSDDRDPEMQSFIEAVRTMFYTTAKLVAFPVKYSKYLMRKDFNIHMESWNTLFRVGKKCVDEKLNEIAENVKKGEISSGLLAYFFAQKSLSTQEIYSNVTELMTGAVDTTSTAMLWALQELALRPDIQEKILQEVKEVGLFPKDSLPTYRNVQDLRYTKAVIKETLRMHPVAVGLSRIVPEDIELSGYRIPAKTSVIIYEHVLNRLPCYYEDPDTFRPERWLRGTGDEIHPFTQLAFGYGTRMCIGRRVAELEMNLFLTRLIRQFRIEADFQAVANSSMEIVLKPDRPVKIKLKERA